MAAGFYRQGAVNSFAVQAYSLVYNIFIASFKAVMFAAQLILDKQLEPAGGYSDSGDRASCESVAYAFDKRRKNYSSYIIGWGNCCWFYHDMEHMERKKQGCIERGLLIWLKGTKKRKLLMTLEKKFLHVDWFWLQQQELEFQQNMNS